MGNYLIDIGGDLITHVDGKAIQAEDRLSKAAARKHAGSRSNSPFTAGAQHEG